jgi:tRNA (cytidine/uridine-2'-O-)-methyltransferase
MFHLILFEPEIPPNTGNIIRLCANTGATLHLVQPLGFSLDDGRLRRAGLDYYDLARVQQHRNLAACLQQFQMTRVFPVETQGARWHHEQAYQPGDAFLFGRETGGLPAGALSPFPAEQVIRLPMVPGNRSLNLSNAAAIVLYEAWRQLGFSGGS